MRWLIGLLVALVLVGVIWAQTLRLVEVHAPDGQMIELNLHEISSISEPRDHLTQEVKCMVIMTNGKFVGVAEDCQTVLDRIAKADR